MNELVDLVVRETGISQEQAQKAVEVIIGLLKSRLPAPIAAHLDGFLSGGAGGEISTLEGEAGEMLKAKLGGLFGGG